MMDHRLREKGILALATAGPLGNLPKAPGTFGTLAGIPVVLVMAWLGPALAVPMAAGLIIVAAWVADEAERLLGTKDPGCIVIDEIAGYMVTMAGLPVTALSLVAGFFVFRVLDIWKPWPIRRLERQFAGGPGIVFDDLLAGVFGALVMRLFF